MEAREIGAPRALSPNPFPRMTFERPFDTQRPNDTRASDAALAIYDAVLATEAGAGPANGGGGGPWLQGGGPWFQGGGGPGGGAARLNRRQRAIQRALQAMEQMYQNLLDRLENMKNYMDRPPSGPIKILPSGKKSFKRSELLNYIMIVQGFLGLIQGWQKNPPRNLPPLQTAQIVLGLHLMFDQDTRHMQRP